MAKVQASLITELERATHSGAHDCAETLRRVTDLFLVGADRFSEDQVLLFEDVLLSYRDLLQPHAVAPA